MTSRPLHQQYIIYRGSSGGGGGEDPDPATYCPANGYELPPDPAVFCPIHGYEKPNEYVPPIEYPDPDPVEGDHILFLCNDEGAGGVSFNVSLAPSGSIVHEIYDANMNLLSSAGTPLVTFPTQGTGNIYIVKIKPYYSDRRISQVGINAPTGYVKQSLMVFQAKFYTPMLTSLTSAFTSMTQFKQCLFFCTLDELTTLYNTFKDSGLEGSITLPNLPKLTTCTGIFEGTWALYKAVIEGESMPELTTLRNACYGSNVREFYYPPILPKLTETHALAGNSQMEYTTIPTYVPLLKSINGWFQNAVKLKMTEITFPEMPALESAANFIYKTPMKKIHFTGDSTSLGNVSYMLDGAQELTEFKFPDNIKGGYGSSTNWQSWMRSNSLLKKIILPLSMPDFFPSSYFIQYPDILEEITTCNDWGTASHQITIANSRLKSFYQPALRITKLTLGKNSPRAPITSVEIDWANSDYSGGSQQISIFGNMSTAEIERIYAALPVVTAKSITIFSPGYPDADKTIAQAKGWTTPGGA